MTERHVLAPPSPRPALGRVELAAGASSHIALQLVLTATVGPLSVGTPPAPVLAGISAASACGAVAIARAYGLDVVSAAAFVLGGQA